MAGQEEKQVIRPRCLAALQNALQHGADGVPDFGPAFATRIAQGGGMLRCNDVAISVVVEHDEVGAPPNQNGETRIQARADGGAKTLRPALDGPELRARPIHRAHERAQFTAAGQEVPG